MTERPVSPNSSISPAIFPVCPANASLAAIMSLTGSALPAPNIAGCSLPKFLNAALSIPLPLPCPPTPRCDEAPNSLKQAQMSVVCVLIALGIVLLVAVAVVAAGLALAPKIPGNSPCNCVAKKSLIGFTINSSVIDA